MKNLIKDITLMVNNLNINAPTYTNNLEHLLQKDVDLQINQSVLPQLDETSFEKEKINCHMDVQCTDGKDLLLQYTTS